MGDELGGGVSGRGSGPDPGHQSLGSVLGKSLCDCANWDLFSGLAFLVVNELD